MNKNCNELVEKYILYENPLYVFSFPISLLVGIIFFGISQAYDWSKNSYVNQILIPIAAILLTMVLIDIISRFMISKKEKNSLIKKCDSFKLKKNNIEKFNDIEEFENDSDTDSDADSDDIENFENESDDDSDDIENFENESDDDSDDIENFENESDADSDTDSDADSDDIENFENESDNSSDYTENFENESDDSSNIENFENESDNSDNTEDFENESQSSIDTYVNSKNDDPYQDDDLDKPSYDHNDKPYLDGNAEPYENIDEDFIPSEMADYSSMNNYNKQMHKTMSKKIEKESKHFSTEAPMDPLTSLSLSPL
jgi:hypothetical protein